MKAEHRLRIGRDDLREIRSHAAASYPLECCGILIGWSRGRMSSVRRAVPAENVHRRRDRSFEISPEAVVAASAEASAEGEEIVGYYHSHPDRPPCPSAADSQDAWPDTSYVIVSVGPGGAGPARSWRFVGGGSLCEEVLVVEGACAPPLLEGGP